MLFFFKQKTAYEMRISDWSSDVCSSDLRADRGIARRILAREQRRGARDLDDLQRVDHPDRAARIDADDRLRVVEIGVHPRFGIDDPRLEVAHRGAGEADRKSTRLNSSH